jgi:hypothetical protein
MFERFYEVPGTGEMNAWAVAFTTPDQETETAIGGTKRHAVLNWGRRLLCWAGRPEYGQMFDEWLGRLRMTY